MFDEIASYSYQIGLILIALVTTIKDWEDFSKARTGRFTPVVVVVFTLLLGFLSIQQTHSQIAKERKASGETVTLTTKVSDSNGRISELTKQIDLLQAANARDTQSFQTSFSKLYDRFSDLQSKVRNQELLKELSDTKKELVATQQKLVIPKIKPLATFDLHGEDLNPITSITVPRSLNDTYTVEFSVVNPSDIQASSGAVILRICEKCSYVEEPQGFKKIAGAGDYDREYDFQRIFSKSQMQALTAKVNVHTGGFYNFFTIALIIRCDNCDTTDQQRLRINVQ